MDAPVPLGRTRLTETAVPLLILPPIVSPLGVLVVNVMLLGVNFDESSQNLLFQFETAGGALIVTQHGSYIRS